jgi:ketosteroid isomerase-like protein
MPGSEGMDAVNQGEELIDKFYSCFAARDADGMCACYHSDVVFSDPVFGLLQSSQAVSLWHLHTARAADLRISYSGIRADAGGAVAHWDATYKFSRTGRHVHNVITAAFSFRDGLIVRHADTFNLWRWAGMALGPAGLLLGWTPIVRAAVRREARRGLEEFMAS